MDDNAVFFAVTLRTANWVASRRWTLRFPIRRIGAIFT
jgi:hypothetical protein